MTASAATPAAPPHRSTRAASGGPRIRVGLGFRVGGGCGAGPGFGFGCRVPARASGSASSTYAGISGIACVSLDGATAASASAASSRTLLLSSAVAQSLELEPGRQRPPGMPGHQQLGQPGHGAPPLPDLARGERSRAACAAAGTAWSPGCRGGRRTRRPGRRSSSAASGRGSRRSPSRARSCRTRPARPARRGRGPPLPMRSPSTTYRVNSDGSSLPSSASCSEVEAVITARPWPPSRSVRSSVSAALVDFVNAPE